MTEIMAEKKGRLPFCFDNNRAGNRPFYVPQDIFAAPSYKRNKKEVDF